MNHKFLNNILTTEELGRRGITKTQIRTLTNRQELDRLSRGVYVYRRFAQSLHKYEYPKAQLVAIAKSFKNPVLSHISAALWLGAPLITPPAKVHLSVPDNSGVHQKNISLHRNRPEVCAAAVSTGGFLTTPPDQTVSDCVNVLPPVETLSIANYFLQQEMCTFEGLNRALTAPRRYHRKRAELVLERLNPLCESPLETLVWDLICTWGIQKPEQQVWFNLGHEDRARVDFLWRDAMVILEADGQVKYDGTYGSVEGAVRKERARQRALERQGWTVIRVEWADATRRPAEILDRLRRAGVG